MQDKHGFDYSLYGIEKLNDMDFNVMCGCLAFLENRVQAPCYKRDPNIEILMKKTITNILGILDLMRMQRIGNLLEESN